MKVLHGYRLVAVTLFMLLPVGMSFLSGQDQDGGDSSSPNIIYILADDLGYADVGCYGGRIIRTPQIDRMCREGMKFTQHYSGSTVCAPTRCVLMTGLHTGHARIRGNGGPDLSPDDITIVGVLRDAGYATGVIGKWGLGEAGSSGIPTKQGFDEWFGYLNQGNAHHYYPPFLWRNEEKILFPDNPVKRTHYSHDLFTEEALGFISRHGKRPFFLYLAYTIPHVDLDVPEDSIEPYLDVIEEKGPYGTPGGQHYRHSEKPRATFAGMVSRLDRDVGRILDKIRESGLDTNTLVIFSSDNGPTPAGGADPDFFDGNGPLRGIKRDLYEGGIRIPMIAWWPGKIHPGSVTDHVSAHWDVFPSLAQLSGAPASTWAHSDGISFLPTLFARPERQQQHDYLYWEFYEQGGKQAIRQGKWKGVRTGLRRNPDARLQLFDLDADVGEQHDLASSFPEVAGQLLRLMHDARTESDFYSWNK
jgi:arylsulfatase A-like enzyme